MITFTVTRNGNKAKIRVPCKEDNIRDVQSQLEIPYDTETTNSLFTIFLCVIPYEI